MLWLGKDYSDRKYVAQSEFNSFRDVVQHVVIDQRHREGGRLEQGLMSINPIIALTNWWWGLRKHHRDDSHKTTLLR